MLRVLKKLLVNLFMLHLLIFLRLHSVLTVFCLQSTQKSSQVSERDAASAKITSLIENKC